MVQLCSDFSSARVFITNTRPDDIRDERIGKQDQIFVFRFSCTLAPKTLNSYPCADEAMPEGKEDRPRATPHQVNVKH